MISIMDDQDMGVALSVTSLIMTLAQDDPEQYRNCYVKAAQRLKKVAVDNECPGDYFYYKVPCPWIQVKLLRMLQYFPPSEDTHTRALIRESLQRIMDNAMDIPKNVQQNNAQNAVLFEAINLVIHLDTEQELMVQISARLGKFIQSRETNVRYLGLEAMTHLAARAETLDPIKKHQQIIIGSLRDRDISVRRQGLDLLYSMCDSSNARPIVAELLKYLQTADYAIREEMVLKIAILTEKYATDVQWYVDISLRLISMAGDHVSDEVWQRVIQIVTNNEELQVYAATTILEYLRADQCHETLVKIGSYLLGEFGHLVADSPRCSPIEQFIALQSKFNACSPNTRAMILSSFIKFVNLFPEIKPQLLNAFKTYSHTLDSELQQRACEYLALATMPTDDLLRTVLDEMPPFPERASALLSRLHSKHHNTTDKRTWVAGGKDANKDILSRNATLKRSFSAGNTLTAATTAGAANGSLLTPIDGTINADGFVSPSGPRTPADELSGLDFATPEPKAPNLASASHLSPNWERGHAMLLTQPEGILYEDAQIQVGLRTEYRAELGCLILYFTNRSQSAPLTSFTISLNNPSPSALKPDIKTLPDTRVAPGAQAMCMIMIECRQIFTAAPTIRISWLAGALQALTLQLPLALHKYLSNAPLGADDFFKRWKQIGGAPREAQKIFKGKDVGTVSTRRILEGFKWGLLDGVDPNPRNFVAAGVLNMAGPEGGAGKVGCLMRLEPNAENMVSYPFIFPYFLARPLTVADVSLDYPRDRRDCASCAAQVDGGETGQGRSTLLSSVITTSTHNIVDRARLRHKHKHEHECGWGKVCLWLATRSGSTPMQCLPRRFHNFVSLFRFYQMIPARCSILL